LCSALTTLMFLATNPARFRTKTGRTSLVLPFRLMGICYFR
jgi:hypothetical protein